MSFKASHDDLSFLRCPRPVRNLALLGAVALGCGPAKPTATLIVDPPAASDTGCIGVVGFDMTLRIGGSDRPRQILLLASPVLSLDACRLPSATTIADLPADQSIEVTVSGYDSAGTLRVTGSGRKDHLDDASFHLALAAASASAADLVLVVDRTKALLTAPADISTLSLRTMQGNTPLLDLSIDANVRPWFTAGEPGAFALGSAFTGLENLTATVATTAAGSHPPAHLVPTLAPNGLYYEAVPQ